MTTSETDHHLVVGIAYELPVLARTEDLMALRAVLPRLRADAAAYPGWQPYLCYAEAAQRSLYGRHDEARERFERGLALAQAGKHAAWAPLVEGYIHALLALHQYDRALEVALHTERTLHELQLRLFEPTHLATALALADAFAGRLERARERIAAHVEHIEQTPRRGLVRGALYETRARIALLEGDDATYAAYLARTADEYRDGEHPGLLARYERLRAAGRHLRERPSLLPGPAQAPSPVADSASAGLLHERLAPCRTAEQRLRAALALAAELSGSSSAYLYACEARAATLAAMHGAADPELTETLTRHVTQFAAEVPRGDDEDTRALDVESTEPGTTAVCEREGRRYFLFALRDPLEPTGISGALVLSDVAGEIPSLPPSFLAALGTALPATIPSSMSG